MSPQGGPNSSLPEVRLRPERRNAPARAETLAATQRLLETRRLHEISVELILREAGLSRPTFYSYFASKLEIVLELYTQAAEDVYAAVSPMYERPEGQSPVEATRLGIAGLIEAWVPHRTVFAAAVEHRYTVPEMMARSEQQVGYFARNIAAQLDLDRAAGVAPAGAASGPLVTTLLWSSEHALYIAGRGLGDGLPDEHAAAEPLTAMWLGSLYGVLS
jgi:AcrR family transcriptional regulator